MDVSVNPVLESVRPFFQGLPTNPPTSSSQGPGPGETAAAPLQPVHHHTPSSSPSVLSYWPHSRPKDPHTPTVYNGTKVAEPHQPSIHHNLPPIAQLSAYQHSRTATATTQRVQQHHQVPSSASQQFRTPDFPQANHPSIFSPNSSRSSSNYQMLPPGSPSPHYGYPPSPHHQQRSPHSHSHTVQMQPSRPPSHHAVSPVIQQSTHQLDYRHQQQIQHHQQQPQAYPTSHHHQHHSQQPQHHPPTSQAYQQKPAQQQGSSQQPSRQPQHQQPHIQHSSSHQQLLSQQQNYSHHTQQQHQQHQQQQQHKSVQPLHQQTTRHAQQAQMLSQQQHQLQQQAALYNQSVQHSSSGSSSNSSVVRQQSSSSNGSSGGRQQSDAERLEEMQQLLREKQRELAAAQAQRQAYYAAAAAAASSSASRPPTQSPATTVEASSRHLTTTNVVSAPAPTPTSVSTPAPAPASAPTSSTATGPKRESPLDLSVKTVRQSADSTAKDDSEHQLHFSHEAYLRSKFPVKSASPRSSAVLPSLQLPSTVIYPPFENNSSSHNFAGGAPKVDFLPNFAHHERSSGSSSSGSQRKNSTSQLPSPSPYPPHASSLPHMNSFKKSSLPTAAYNDPNKQTQYYPATGPPNHQRSTPLSTPLVVNTQPSYPAPTNQYPYDHSKRESSARYDYPDRRSSFSYSKPPYTLEQNSPLGKRQSSSEMRHPLPPKIPKVDTWRQAIDQQIEQKLNSYTSQRAHQMNGNKESSLSSPFYQSSMSAFSSTPSSSVQTSHTSTNAPSNSSTSTLPNSHELARISSSKQNLVSQYYPHAQPQYPPHSLMSQRLSHEYNNMGQVKLPSLPSNGAADKRVLSILRKRLDTREASNQLIQQQQQQQSIQHLQDRAKLYTTPQPTRYYPQPMVAPAPVIASQAKLPPQTPITRHHLPSFNALSLEHNASMPYSSQKLHLPKAVDSVVPEYSHPPQALPPSTRPRSPPQVDATGKPTTGSGSDFDGLAAFLAARIRTKAELKQVGPTGDQSRQQTPAGSGSNSSAHSPRTTPGIFSPPPSSQINYPAVPSDFSKGLLTPESDRASSSGYSSPMKSFRDRYAINSPRRKLFNEMGVSGESVIQAREAGLRSSSETSVFDFRESDSEGEGGPERQSLTDMRKDRDRRIQEKHQQQTDPAADLVQLDSEPIEDSFWGGICDQFVGQLQKGGMKVRKRGRRKKWKYIPIELIDEDDLYEQEVKTEPEPFSSSSIEKTGSSDEVANINNSTVSSKIEVDEKPSTDVLLPKLVNSEDSNIVPISDIKVEKDISLEESKIETQMEERKEVKEAATVEPKVLLKNIKTEDESDEDTPLSVRQTELKKIKEDYLKTENKISERKESPDIYNDSLKSRCKNKTEDIKKEIPKEEPIEDVSESENESSEDENVESVAKRLRARKPNEKQADDKRKTRSSEKENTATPTKGGKKKKEEKKKSIFGDGSEFRPGWEAEVYRYKRSLRMPPGLINIAGPQSWPRLSTSLPDLDPDSPMTLDSELSQHSKVDSDTESTTTKSKPKDPPKNKTPKKEKVEDDSFINRLMQRYGGKGKKTLRKALERDNSKEKKGPKIIPQTNEPELLPTPSLDSIVKGSGKKLDEITTKGKTKKKKSGKEPIDSVNRESIFLGYFKKNTLANFKDTFAKHNGGFTPELELPSLLLKSRTRTQTRILTQRASIREVFGEDRPASAPPAGCRDEESEENKKPESNDKKLKKTPKSSKKLLHRRSSGNGISTRSGLRSAAVLRSHKAVLKSRNHLLHGGERRKRDKDLIKSFKTPKKQIKETETENKGFEKELTSEPLIKSEAVDDIKKEDVFLVPTLVSEKRLKIRSVRRKLKSSGFDYIRKKKKQIQKKEGDSEAPKEKKKTSPVKPVLESEEDIQNEIKGWVINKGLGESVLHRAARLGYTDIAAYCLEKMDHNPSPRDNAGYTPLHEACSKNRLDIARLLLLYGADVSDSAQGGIRPLHEAAEHGNLEMIRLLLSYGADPLLATYSGLTPLSLAHNPEARALLQNHLADVQAMSSTPWQIQLTDSDQLLGNEVLADAPSPDVEDPDDEGVEFEAGELSLPHLYQLRGEPLADRWALFQELGPVLRVKTRDQLIKQLGPSHRNDFRDLKMTEFYDMATCCSVLGVGDRTLNPKAHKVTLVKYSERVRQLLNSEVTTISSR